MKHHEGVGAWDKILSRYYRLASLAGSRTLRKRALQDILDIPSLTPRICDYVRNTGTPSEYLDFLDDVWAHDEQIHGWVNAMAAEQLLRLEAWGTDAKRIRRIGARLLRAQLPIQGATECAALPPLLLMRFGDRRCLPSLASRFETHIDKTPKDQLRAAAAVYMSYGIKRYERVRKAASKLHRNILADLVRLVERVVKYKEVPLRYSNRIKVDFDPVSAKHYLDTRGLLQARILGLNESPNVTQYLSQKKQSLLRKDISDFDKELLERLWPTS